MGPIHRKILQQVNVYCTHSLETVSLHLLIYPLTHPSGQGEHFAAEPKENSVGELSPHRSSVPSPTQKYPLVQPRHLGLVVEFRAKN